MKDSGIPWIGEIPSHWKVMPHKWVMHKEKQIKEQYEGEKILSLTMKGVIVRDLDAGGKMPSSFDGYQVVYPNDLLQCLFDIDVTPRCVGLVRQTGLVSPAYSRFVMHKEACSAYYDYLLRFMDDNKVLLHLSKNLRSSLTETDYGAINTCVPPIHEQQAIADFLDKKCSEIDELISLQEKIIEELKSYKLSKTKEVFDCYLENESYSISKLGGLASLVTKQTGFDYSNTISPSLVGELTDDTIPYLQTKHFKDGYWNYDTDYYIPKEVAANFPKIILNKQCLLFSIVGASIGNVAVFPATTTAFLGGAICKVDLIEESYYDYIKQYMLSYYGQEQISSKINASAQGTITVQNVRDFKIPLFDNIEVQNKITKEVGDLSENIALLIKAKQSKIEQLKEYKKSLIYEYVTGKKEVTI